MQKYFSSQKLILAQKIPKSQSGKYLDVFSISPAVETNNFENDMALV